MAYNVALCARFLVCQTLVGVGCDGSKITKKADDLSTCNNGSQAFEYKNVLYENVASEGPNDAGISMFAKL